MAKPLCDICGTQHEKYQGHVFASNAASNANASNTGADRSAAVALQNMPDVAAVPVRPPYGSYGEAVQRNNVAPVVPLGRRQESGDSSHLGDRKQRWSREAYNRYQRDLMRRRRAGLR